MRRPILQAVVTAVATLSIACSGESPGTGDLLGGSALPTHVSASPSEGLVGDRCIGLVGAVTVENLIVPSQAACRLDGTVVTGNLEVRAGASLWSRGVHVDGNFQAFQSRVVTMEDSSHVGGDVQLEEVGEALIVGARIGGNLQLEKNRGAVQALVNQVEGNLQAFENHGGLTIADNTIRQNLQCQENWPAPIGGANAAGSKEGQCAGL